MNSSPTDNQSYAQAQGSQDYLWVLWTPLKEAFLFLDCVFLLKARTLHLPFHLVQKIIDIEEIFVRMLLLCRDGGLHAIFLYLFISFDDILVVLSI